MQSRKLPEQKKIYSWLGLTLLSLLGLGVNTFLFHQAIVGSIFLLLYFLVSSLFFGRVIFPQFPKAQKLAFGFLITLCELILLGTGIYYLYKITALVSWLLLFIPPLSSFLLFLFSSRKQRNEKPPTMNISTPSPLAPTGKLDGDDISSIARMLPVIALDLFLLFYLWSHRTYDLLASPWQNVSIIFFIGYFLTTVLLLWNYQTQKEKNPLYLLTSLHLFVGFSVVALLYPLGYGFDAFIHRATEQWIWEHGFILPKAPYYIGEYSLIVLLTHVTALPLKFINIYLLPFLSSLLLPPIVLFSWQKSFPNYKTSAPFVFWLIACIPFLFFHLTTPHNIVVFLTLITIFCLLLALFNQFPLWLLWLLAGAAIATHALVGVPLFVVIGFFFIIKNIKNIKRIKIPLLLLIIILALLLPLLFTLNAARIDAPLPNIGNPFKKLPVFIDLFARPYWYAKTSPLRFEIIYWLERLIVPSLLGLALIGSFALSKEVKNKHLWIFTTAFLGFFASAFTLTSSIVFPDVVAYEQKDYPLRLMRVSLLFLLPSVMYGLAWLIKKNP